MKTKICTKCKEEKPATYEYWQCVSKDSKRGKAYPNVVGRPYGACRVCRSKYNNKYNATDAGKKARREAHEKRMESSVYRQRLVYNQIERGKENIKKLIEYKGGKCERCGYDKCPAALDFHHIDPSSKSFGISQAKLGSLERLKEEADKCILLCSNCHREHHYEEDSQKQQQRLKLIQEADHSNDK